MKPTRGYIESGTTYEPAHITAQQECPVCNKALGYDTPLVSYDCETIIHEQCKERWEELCGLEY